MGDIFDPAYCDRDLNRYHTQHDVNNWFWKQIKKIECNISKLDKCCDNSKFHLAELDKITTRINVDIADIYKTLKTLAEEDKLMRSDFITFKTEVNKVLDLYRSDIDKLAEDLDRQNTRINDHESKIGRLNNKFNDLKSKVDDYDFDTILEAFKKNEKRFDAIDKTLEEHKTTDKNLRDDLTTEITDRLNGDAVLTTTTQKLRDDLTKQIATETKHFTDFTNKDKEQDKAFNDHVKSVDKTITNFKTEFNNHVTKNKNEHEEFAENISKNHTEITNSLNEEKQKRQLEDEKINSKFNEANNKLTEAIKSEVKLREDEDQKNNTNIVKLNDKYDSHNKIIINNANEIKDLKDNDLKLTKIINEEIIIREEEDNKILSKIPKFTDWTRLIYVNNFNLNNTTNLLIPIMEAKFTISPNTNDRSYSVNVIVYKKDVEIIYLNGEQKYNKNSNTTFNGTFVSQENYGIHNLIGYGTVEGNLLEMTIWYTGIVENINEFYKVRLFTNKTYKIGFLQAEILFDKKIFIAP